jgi:ComF family protein
MSLTTSLLDLFFPPRCAFCGKLFEHLPTGVCPECEKDLPYRGEASLKQVGGLRCAVAFYYDDMVKDGVHALKFGKKSARAVVFGRYIAQVASERLAGEFDAVTFVPVSAQRRFRRGFDQAEELARAAAKTWDLPVEKTLKKVRNNRAQSSLDSPDERRENVRDAYRPRRGADIAGRRFLLIDDVLTTGSTISACAQVLLSAGAESVVCAALAGGHRGN